MASNLGGLARLAFASLTMARLVQAAQTNKKGLGGEPPNPAG